MEFASKAMIHVLMRFLCPRLYVYNHRRKAYFKNVFLKYIVVHNESAVRQLIPIPSISYIKQLHPNKRIPIDIQSVCKFILHFLFLVF